MVSMPEFAQLERGKSMMRNFPPNGGVHILPPYQSAKGATWFKGTANAIYQNIGFVDMYDPDYVLILSGDHIYKWTTPPCSRTTSACTPTAPSP